MKIIGANVTGSFILNNQDVTTTIQTSNVWSGSVATDITALNAATASLNAATASLLDYTASQNISNGTYATTGSNTFVGTQYISNTTTATTFTSTASLYTDGGLRVGKDSYVSGSMFVKGNLTVFGTSSIEYVTSSVFVGLEYIDLNTDAPALRYAGIRVYDSGSNAGVTGSLLWDSQNNRWVYSNPSGSSYDGAMFISGPRNSSGLGNEVGTTNNALMKGQGGDHITSSAILDDGTSLRIPYLTIVTGTVGATTFSGSGANLTSIPNAALNNNTISGIALGSNLATLTIGTGLSGTSYNGSTGVTIANSGVTSIVAGTNISISSGTGAVTITNGVTNTNQLTNGAGFITSAGTAAAISTTVSAPNEANLVYAQIADNDFFRIRVGGSSNAGWVELATADDGTEPIYLRQYTGTFSSVTRTATLLDGSGNTSFPGSLSASNLSGTNTGDQTNISGNAATATTLVSNSSVTGMNFSGVFALAGSGASTGNSTGARLSESYGALWNFSDSATWHHQIINGSSLVGLQASGTNFGSGRIYATGDITAYYSDMRLKTKISNINNALDKVIKLNGFYYINNDVAKENGYTDEDVQVGVSAQEVESVLPEIVKLAPFDIGCGENGEKVSKSGQNYKTVSYEKLTPLLIEAIKEQQSQIEELKTIINGLTK